MGWKAGLKDLPHSPKKPSITMEAKAWLINIACQKPKELGKAAEIWSHQSLANYARENAEQAGHPSLNKAAKATVARILNSHHLKPHKVKYYLENRDPDFEEKMYDVLMIYKEVLLQETPENVYTVCVDEKPRVQAIENTAKDLPPVPDKYPEIARDHEYKRHGTVSILAGLDLKDGHVFALVEERHRSVEFIELLEMIDKYYPEGQIRLINDNHSVHTSKETRAYLATKPNRFVYVHTPKHGSWLNLVETLFGKMTKTFLKNIRVSSKEELKERILLGVAEINKNPVIHQWKSFSFVKKYLNPLLHSTFL